MIKKQQMLEPKHFNIFVSVPLNELFLLLKFSSLWSKSLKNSLEMIQFLDR